MTDKLLMPKIAGFENGTFGLPESNGWHTMINNPTTSRPGLTSVLLHDDTGAELTVACSHLGEGATVHLLLVLPGEGTYHHEVDFGGGENDTEAWTNTINGGLGTLQGLYDEDHK